jgi:hypothetical protein
LGAIELGLILELFGQGDALFSPRNRLLDLMLDHVQAGAHPVGIGQLTARRLRFQNPDRFPAALRRLRITAQPPQYAGHLRQGRSISNGLVELLPDCQRLAEQLIPADPIVDGITFLGIGLEQAGFFLGRQLAGMVERQGVHRYSLAVSAGFGCLAGGGRGIF